MPVGFLSDDQARRFGRFGPDLTPDQLARHFHLDDVDRAFVAEQRGDHNRLGIAVQLGAVRHTGTFVDEIVVPHAALRYVADQLAVLDPAAAIAAYAVGEARWRHRARIRSRYGYREFAEPFVAFRLTRFLYALCWTGTDRPSSLFDRAAAWLIAAKVLLPGATVLERTVARIRARAGDHFHRRLVRTLTVEQRAALDALVTVPQGSRQSPLDRLRDGPTLLSGPEIVRAMRRLVEVRALCEGLPDVDRLPPGKVQALARFAMAAKAQAIERLPDDRRAATLLAFVRTLEAAALRELGRVVKTLYLLRYIDDAAYRRHILIQLNRHEGRHRVARAIFHGRRGELRQRYREGQEDQLGALGLVTNMVVLWNTIYMDAALNQIAREGHDIRPEDVARLSPLVHTHVNMLGRYAFTLPDNVAAGELRPLRDPRTATLDDP